MRLISREWTVTRLRLWRSRVLGVRAEGHTISRYESDVYEPKLRAFAVLARALGVTVEVLLYGEEEAARITAERESPGDDTASAGG